MSRNRASRSGNQPGNLVPFPPNVGKKILEDADGAPTTSARGRAHLRSVQIRIPMDDLKQIDSDLGAVERACAAARMLLINTRFKQENPDRVRRMVRSVFEALNHDINGTGNPP